MSSEIEVTRTYLQMTDPGRLVIAPAPAINQRVDEVLECSASFYRFLYIETGRKYHWTERLTWSDEQILEHLRQPSIRLFVLYVEGAPAGYYELSQCEDRSTEIAYFGLMQEYLGKGLGKYFLCDAVIRAWSTGAERVWLHTCTLDDPAAMPNYLGRGFVPFKQEKYRTII